MSRVYFIDAEGFKYLEGGKLVNPNLKIEDLGPKWQLFLLRHRTKRPKRKDAKKGHA